MRRGSRSLPSPGMKRRLLPGWSCVAWKAICPFIRASALGLTGSRLWISRCSQDRKSTRLNSSHTVISYAVFCLKKKTNYYEIKSIPAFGDCPRLFRLANSSSLPIFFFFNDTATTEIYTLSLHDALPISAPVMVAASDGESPMNNISAVASRSEEHTSELQSHSDLVCRLLLEKKKTQSPFQIARAHRARRSSASPPVRIPRALDLFFF